MDYQTIAYLLMGAVFSGYAILDGFDLGVGALHLFAKEDRERRILINAIGPVWDGNEVWLVTGGGVLFAAFPEVYATLLSGAYDWIMLLFAGLIFRAVAIEFRSKEPMKWWRNLWDISFSVASILLAILFGTILGNLIWGIAIDQTHEYAGSTWDFIHPYSVLIGFTTLFLFMNHGSIYLAMKTEGDLQRKVVRWGHRTTVMFVVTYVLATMATLVYLPDMAEKFREHPIWFVLPVFSMLAVANVPRAQSAGRFILAFLSSSAVIASLLGVFALGLFPVVLPSTLDPSWSLDIYNSTSSVKTLRLILIIAAIGVPFVLSYSISIFWIFRGKVKLDEHSY